MFGDSKEPPNSRSHFVLAGRFAGRVTRLRPGSPREHPTEAPESEKQACGSIAKQHVVLERLPIHQVTERSQHDGSIRIQI